MCFKIISEAIVVFIGKTEISEFHRKPHIPPGDSINYLGCAEIETNVLCSSGKLRKCILFFCSFYFRILLLASLNYMSYF